MAKNGKIGHEGVVKSVSEQTIEVVIVSHSACSGCHAKGACGMADVQQKIIKAENPGFQLHSGDKVMVYASVHNAAYSVIMAYVIPTFIIIGTIFLLIKLDYEETTAALASLLAGVLYFFILYINRKRIGKKINFTIEKKEA